MVPKIGQKNYYSIIWACSLVANFLVSLAISKSSRKMDYSGPWQSLEGRCPDGIESSSARPYQTTRRDIRCPKTFPESLHFLLQKGERETITFQGPSKDRRQRGLTTGRKFQYKSLTTGRKFQNFQRWSCFSSFSPSWPSILVAVQACFPGSSCSCAVSCQIPNFEARK